MIGGKQIFLLLVPIMFESMDNSSRLASKYTMLALIFRDSTSVIILFKILFAKLSVESSGDEKM